MFVCAEELSDDADSLMSSDDEQGGVGSLSWVFPAQHRGEPFAHTNVTGDDGSRYHGERALVTLASRWLPR